MIIYADDTTFWTEKTTGKEIVGVGCLLLDTDNTNEIISAALDELAQKKSTSNPRAISMDNKTIARKYFHASEDSYNAHSILTEQINNKLKASFQYSYSPAEEGGKDKAWQDCLQYLSIVTNETKDTVTIYLEQRSAQHISGVENTIRHTNNGVDWGKYDLYAIPSFFPKVEIHLVDKMSSGVQIVDLLLWANNRRNYSIPEKIVEEKFKFSSKSKTGDLESFLFQGNIVFRGGVRESVLNLYPQTCFPLPEFQGQQQIISLFKKVLTEVSAFLSAPPHSHCAHLLLQFSSIPKQIAQDGGLSMSTLAQVSSCFIRIFDMKPIYKSSLGTNDFQELLLAKRLCGLTLRKDLMPGTLTAQFLVKQFRNSPLLPVSK